MNCITLQQSCLGKGSCFTSSFNAHICLLCIPSCHWGITLSKGTNLYHLGTNLSTNMCIYCTKMQLFGVNRLQRCAVWKGIHPNESFCTFFAYFNHYLLDNAFKCQILIYIVYASWIKANQINCTNLTTALFSRWSCFKRSSITTRRCTNICLVHLLIITIIIMLMHKTCTTKPKSAARRIWLTFLCCILKVDQNIKTCGFRLNAQPNKSLH